MPLYNVTLDGLTVFQADGVRKGGSLWWTAVQPVDDIEEVIGKLIYNREQRGVHYEIRTGGWIDLPPRYVVVNAETNADASERIVLRAPSEHPNPFDHKALAKQIRNNRSLRTANDVAEWLDKKSSETAPVGRRQAYPSE
jgi:hypothetical protein